MIDVMISSTIKDLLGDRDAVQKSLQIIPFVRSVGASPVRDTSHNKSPYVTTIDMAENCDLYILLLGGRFGSSNRGGKSATEVEFDAAYKSDPTKILIFQKEGVEVDAKQQRFIKRIGSYYTGYWITKYEFTHDLQKIVVNSFEQWIKERASIGYKLNYFDHFVRVVIQRIPIPGSQIFYTVSEDHIELRYKIFDRIYIVHFDKSQVYNDFWGCTSSLETYFDKWRKESYGRGV